MNATDYGNDATVSHQLEWYHHEECHVHEGEANDSDSHCRVNDTG